MDTEAPTKELKKCIKKTLGLYCAAINHHNFRRNCKFSMFRFPKQDE